MSLTARFSTLLLSVLGVVLIGFSTTLYLAAWTYMERRLKDRLSAALAVLAAAAEIHPHEVEWEPQERVLSLGQEADPERLRWAVFDEGGNLVDHSRSLPEEDLASTWRPEPGTARLPRLLSDRQGREWRVAQRKIGPRSQPGTGSAIVVGRGRQAGGARRGLFRNAFVLTVCAPLDPMRSTLASLGLFLGVTGLSIWLIAALLCRRLSRRALAPLSRMVASARGLDATDPGWFLEEAGTGDELDELGHAFNDLLSRLSVAFQRYRRFSSDASHQLRTPLTALIGQIEVALRQQRTPEEYRRVLWSALDQSVHLAQIVESLLFLARAEADAALPEVQVLDLHEWAAAYLSAPTLLVPADRIVHQRGDAPVFVLAHPPLLGQLLGNLLDNSVKYGGSHAPIVVETGAEGDSALLAVRDEGPGIPPDDLPHILEPFYRSARARRQVGQGVGLGLAVVDRIARALGGRVRVQSEPGRGARFEVRLPIFSVDDPAETAEPEPAGRPPGLWIRP
jgi:signal transduction histidine kinase